MYIYLLFFVVKNKFFWRKTKIDGFILPENRLWLSEQLGSLIIMIIGRYDIIDINKEFDT